ncbi:MAG: PQQ-binding-like beta-propeller repeat protein [Candidatus Micrarchaeia archaeon]
MKHKAFIFTADAIIAFYLITIMLSILLLINYVPRTYVQQYQSLAKDTLNVMSELKLSNITGKSNYPYANYLLYVKNNSLSRWPMFRRTLNNNASSLSILSINPNSSSVWWITRVGPFGVNVPVYSSPSVDNGKVVVASRNGTYAFDENTGVKLWYLPISTDSSPAFQNGKIFIGGLSNDFYVLDEGGNLLWNVTLGDRIVSSPKVHNGKVFIASMDSTIYAFDEDSGKSVWNFTAQGNISSSPAVYNGKVFVFSPLFGGGANFGFLYALDEENGKLLWRYEITDPTPTTFLDPSPATRGDEVYIGTGHYFYAINITNGTQMWNISIGAYNFTSSPVIDNDTAYIGYTNGICVVNLTTRSFYVRSLNSIIHSSPVIANDTIVVATNDGVIAVYPKYDIDVNNPLWRYKVNASIYSSPAVVNGRIFIGANNGNLYAFGNCSAWDENMSILDSIAAFWYIGKKECAVALAKEFLDSAIPSRYGFELVVKGQGMTGFYCDGRAGAPWDSLYTNDCNQTKYRRILIQESKYISGVVRTGTMVYYNRPIEIRLMIWN